MLKKGRILIVEDEADIREMLAFNLGAEGYEVFSAESGEEGLECARKNSLDLIILDLMLPGIDGLDVCRKLKEDLKLRTIRILMLTARGEEIDVVTGLETGADDYMAKPFSPRILMARIKNLLRRETVPSPNEELIESRGLSINSTRRKVSYLGKRVELSFSEFNTLLFLAKHPGWVYSRYQIVDAIHGEGHPITERAVDVMIVSLRKKLGEASGCIQTVRGVGYKFKE